MFLQFIDGLFIIWTSTEEELLKFINKLNKKKHKMIKFDFKYSKRSTTTVDPRHLKVKE